MVDDRDPQEEHSQMLESFNLMVQGRDQALKKLEEVHNEINTIKDHINELGKKITKIKEFI
ncbi:43169_t:CDS:2 [Gigaspora margarita]|uniref:43169_t:CDS:1 n=1 Tax=Gigaspora margarita TaxID=4874 RepID=A0ABN7VZC2_GIGMA|nr:43169_t:CDS:2 [Gigaspora margarita]